MLPVPARAVKLDGADAFRGHLVVHEREAGLRQIRVIDLASGEDHRVAFPEPVYTVRTHENPEFDTATPPVHLHVAGHAELGGGLRHGRAHAGRCGSRPRCSAGTTHRCTGASGSSPRRPDGTAVPVSLVYRRPLERDGKRPLLLNGYGAYGVSFDPSFSSNT